MGRNYTGATTTAECTRIELSALIRWGYFKKGCIVSGNIKWTNGNAISISVDYTEQNPVMTVIYTVTDHSTGQKYPYNYDIDLVKRPSNLGKGEVLFFVCPDSGRRCRILYRAYGYHKWKCREAYQNRIYYPLQVCSKRGKYNDRYWQLEHKLDEYRKGRKSYTYNGKETKRAAKVRAMIKERNRMDVIRWSAAAMPKALLKITKGRDIWDYL